MNPSLRKATAVAVLFTLATTACSELITAPKAPGSQVSRTSSVSTGFAGPAAKNLSRYGCVVTAVDPVSTTGFRRSSVQLYFPSSAISLTGATRRVAYRGYADGAKLNRLLVCEIPATRAAIQLTELRFGIDLEDRSSARKGHSAGEVGTLGDEDAVPLDPLVVTACQYGGMHPECNPAPADPYKIMNDCSLYGVCAGGGTWYWGEGGGGGGVDGGTYSDGGPFLGAITCLLAGAATGASMLDVADKFASVILTGRRAGAADRTYVMYNQQSYIDPTMHIQLESEMNQAKQAYRDAIGDLASAMRTSFLTAGGSALACGAAFALPTP